MCRQKDPPLYFHGMSLSTDEQWPFYSLPKHRTSDKAKERALLGRDERICQAIKEYSLASSPALLDRGRWCNIVFVNARNVDGLPTLIRNAPSHNRESHPQLAFNEPNRYSAYRDESITTEPADSSVWTYKGESFFARHVYYFTSANEPYEKLNAPSAQVSTMPLEYPLKHHEPSFRYPPKAAKSR